MSARERMYEALRGNVPIASETARIIRGDERKELQRRLRALEYSRRDADIELFLQRAGEVGAQTQRCANTEEAMAYITAHIGSGKQCVFSADPLLLRMEAAKALSAQDNVLSFVTDAKLAQENEHARHAYAAADVGVTVAWAGIADAGALLIASSEYESRCVSLLCVEHIAVLPAERIVGSLYQAGALLDALTTPATETALRESVAAVPTDKVTPTPGDNLHILKQRVSRPPESGQEPAAIPATSADARLQELRSAVTLVCGPSKTADIEKVLVTGVHGPAVLTIVVVDDIA